MVVVVENQYLLILHGHDRFCPGDTSSPGVNDPKILLNITEYSVLSTSRVNCYPVYNLLYPMVI